jgi:periplasmic protein TonB
MRPIVRHLIAIICMFGGTTFVFGAVYAMNAAVPPASAEPERVGVDFHVERLVEKPKPPPERRQRRREIDRTPRSAPAPRLGSSIAGPSFDLPQFELADLSAASESMLGSSSHNQVFSADAIDETPRVLERVSPEWPAKAKQRGVTGHVKLNLLVNMAGEVEKAKVLEASPQGVFEQSALSAVQRWRFEPPRYQGEAVSVWLKQTVRFDLR